MLSRFESRCVVCSQIRPVHHDRHFLRRSWFFPKEKCTSRSAAWCSSFFLNSFSALRKGALLYFVDAFPFFYVLLMPLLLLCPIDAFQKGLLLCRFVALLMLCFSVMHSQKMSCCVSLLNSFSSCLKIMTTSPLLCPVGATFYLCVQRGFP